ncbi:methyltransferase domain-containing protein [Alkalilimnicola sp. S0819]|uniref:methyltransferase domain-containing protein n=1 Tax=Alkalilimnicola sp. S0819 TaxID=2613922 RepID=UPI001262617B|nr:methyltransferase domain-containing protein [Alkalilimnicola sp. S0819]KAB7624098.1 methyltransferase domain-containing protein [Alkalilimnicola sp. S0819]MPQ16349.1 methyltransferase domain-containing protein [Alkalilimnicola sp. S0819]
MTDFYTHNAHRLFEQYQSLAFEDVHRDWLAYLPAQPGFALDVGAGSGRDAAALAARGWEVLAVEPSRGLRALGEQATAGQTVQWLDDALVELARVCATSQRFNLILVSAVWMHLAPGQRERAFRILTELLAPGGLLVISLRHGPSDDERRFYPCERGELEAYARKRALLTAAVCDADDRLGRETVRWETLVFRLPDDGTGSLPLLRHIIVNDQKSSTYKLGLLRAITRIADSVPGLVLSRDDDWVEIPFGLVGLYWIKLYQPLILRHGLRQLREGAGYGFAKDAFYALETVSPLDLRVGQSLHGDLAATVLQAIRDACATIAGMPVRHTTWPGGSTPVFAVERGRGFRIRPEPIRLDRARLARFGRFRIPAALWDCCSRYACWLEPAIVNEWADLMAGYQTRYDRDTFARALRWEEGRRDTGAVRRLIDARLASGQGTACVWTARALRPQRYEVDHCLPWSRWENNDLWNLLPASITANSAKSEKLPAAALLQDARSRIVDWWEAAYLGGERECQFYAEAQAALPMIGERRDLPAVFEGLAQQRMRLKMNQQLAEWQGLI